MTDAFDLTSARIVNAPDVKTWRITTAISQVIFDGSTTRVVFDKQDGPTRWPDVTPPQWDGPLQYTLWLFRKLGDRWVGSAFIQFWHGRLASGNVADPDVPSLYHLHWYYDKRWAPLYGSGPIVPGEQIGFMVSSGNGRDRVGPMSVQERSNVVVFPATDNGSYRFPEAQPPDTGGGTGTGEAPSDDATMLEAVIALTMQMQQLASALGTITSALSAMTTATGEIQRVQRLGLKGSLFGYTLTLTPPEPKANGQANG